MRMLRTPASEVAIASTSRSTRSAWWLSERVNNCRSLSSATSSARRADPSTVTTIQTIASATMTPIGTTTLART